MWAAAFGSEIGTTKSQISALSSDTRLSLSDDATEPAVFPSNPTPKDFDSIITLTRSVEIALSSPFPRVHLIHALKWFPSLRDAKSRKDAFIKDRLDDAWKRFSTKTDGKLKSATDLLVQIEVAMAEKEARPPVYDTPAIRDELFGFLAAGHDTTSITLRCGLKFLTANQQPQIKLRKALTQCFNSVEQPSVQGITNADIPFLDATIQDVHRLGGKLSANVRIALCDTRVLGCHIPKGTDIFMVSERWRELYSRRD